MAAVRQFRTDEGAADVDPSAVFLVLLYVLPERWGQGIVPPMLDAVVEEAARRGSHRTYLWTHERHNDRAQRLYRSRGFVPAGRTKLDDTGEPMGEWRRED